MARLRDIDIKMSIADAICFIMQDGAIWPTPYTVYREQDFEAMARGSPPARPFVFVMAARREIEPRFLPIILVDVELKRIAFELGHTSRQADIQLHIMARSEGEGEMIKDAILTALEESAIEFYAYPLSASSAPVTAQYCEPEWVTTVSPIPEAFLNEGSLRYWTVTAGSIILL